MSSGVTVSLELQAATPADEEAGGEVRNGNAEMVIAGMEQRTRTGMQKGPSNSLNRKETKFNLILSGPYVGSFSLAG